MKKYNYYIVGKNYIWTPKSLFLNSILKKTNSFTYVFFALLLIDACFNNIESLYEYKFIPKICIFVALATHFFLNGEDLLTREKILIIIGLVFFFIGDVCFINYNSTNFFVIGMASFLVAKLLYGFAFLSRTVVNIERLLPFLAILALYVVIIMYYLTEGAGSLIIPLFAYCAAAIFMVTASYLRYRQVNLESYAMVFAGSLFFIASDTISGFDKFYKPMVLSNSLILLCFGSGQYWIIRGMLAEVNEACRPSFFRDTISDENGFQKESTENHDDDQGQ